MGTKFHYKSFIPLIKENWKDAAKWFTGALIGLLLAKACDRVWPDTPMVVKEVTDTVTVIHSMTPIPTETDSLIKEQVHSLLKNIELMSQYEEESKRVATSHGEIPCKMILGNPYPNSFGYTLNSSSSFCHIEINKNNPYLDITYRFIRDDYASIVNTLDVKIIRKKDAEKDLIILDQHFEPHKGSEQLIRIVDDLSPGDYLIEAGVFLKEDQNAKYPVFYSQKLNYIK